MTEAEYFKKLKKLCESLDQESRQSLLDFAQFLSSRESNVTAGAQPASQEPVVIPRPDQETVVGAIKRLRLTYPMLDRSKLLNDASMLMSQHILQGRAATEVINELELLFARQFSHYADTTRG